MLRPDGALRGSAGAPATCCQRHRRSRYSALTCGRPCRVATGVLHPLRLTVRLVGAFWNTSLEPMTSALFARSVSRRTARNGFERRSGRGRWRGRASSGPSTETLQRDRLDRRRVERRRSPTGVGLVAQLHDEQRQRGVEGVAVDLRDVRRDRRVVAVQARAVEPDLPGRQHGDRANPLREPALLGGELAGRSTRGIGPEGLVWTRRARRWSGAVGQPQVVGRDRKARPRPGASRSRSARRPRRPCWRRGATTRPRRPRAGRRCRPSSNGSVSDSVVLRCRYRLFSSATVPLLATRSRSTAKWASAPVSSLPALSRVPCGHEVGVGVLGKLDQHVCVGRLGRTLAQAAAPCGSRSRGASAVSVLASARACSSSFRNARNRA